MHDLAIGCLAVAEHQVVVDWHVVLATWVPNLQGWEPGVHTEGTSLIWDDWNYALAQFLIAHDFLERTNQSHGGSNFLLTRALANALELIDARCLQRSEVNTTLRQEAAEFFTTLQHVLNFWRIIARVVVRRNRWVLLQSLIGDWNALLIAEALEVFQG